VATKKKKNPPRRNPQATPPRRVGRRTADGIPDVQSPRDPPTKAGSVFRSLTDEAAGTWFNTFGAEHVSVVALLGAYARYVNMRLLRSAVGALLGRARLAEILAELLGRLASAVAAGELSTDQAPELAAFVHASVRDMKSCGLAPVRTRVVGDEGVQIELRHYARDHRRTMWGVPCEWPEVSARALHVFADRVVEQCRDVLREAYDADRAYRDREQECPEVNALDLDLAAVVDAALEGR